MTAPAITLDEQVTAVERAAKGIRSADVRRQTAALVAAAHTLRQERDRRMSAADALAKYDRIDDTRLSASLERARTPT